jgi:DNA topoisomerase-3
VEKQLKDIEKERTPASFINNMKKMIAVLVDEVRRNRDALIYRIYRNCSKKKFISQKKAAGILAEICPKCKKKEL